MAAIIFGIGAALVLDEYALILHLSDVYWEEDGRTSVDAVFAAVAVAGLLILGFNPLMFFASASGAKTFVAGAGRGRRVGRADAAAGGGGGAQGQGVDRSARHVLPPLLVIGAIRLSRPHAPWARWRYTTRPNKMRRALERERRIRRPVVQAKLWLQCAIAGTPRFPDDDAVDAQLDHEIHAAAAPGAASKPRSDRWIGCPTCGISTTPSSSTTAAPSS